MFVSQYLFFVIRLETSLLGQLRYDFYVKYTNKT